MDGWGGVVGGQSPGGGGGVHTPSCLLTTHLHFVTGQHALQLLSLEQFVLQLTKRASLASLAGSNRARAAAAALQFRPMKVLTAHNGLRT